MLKSTGFALAICCLLLGASSAAQAAPADDAALAPIQQFADNMNAGDMTKAGAAFTPSASIIDEFAPHHWNSFGDWMRDAGAFFKANGVADTHVTFGAATDKVIGAAQAYAVVPTTLTSTTNGKPTTEKGIFTFVLVNDTTGWHIAACTWTTL